MIIHLASSELFMKLESNLTYKKIRSRTNSVNINKLIAVRLLFIVEFYKILAQKTLIINVDESSINRHIKSNYSWSTKGNPAEWLNSPYTRSTSIYMAVCSNGTIDSVKFSTFIEHLENWLKENHYFEIYDILLIMENWSIHKTKAIKDKLANWNLNVLFLPCYTPQWAPIESCFGIIKYKLRKEKAIGITNSNQRKNYSLIYNWMKALRAETIKKLFADMLNQIKNKTSLVIVFT